LYHKNRDLKAFDYSGIESTMGIVARKSKKKLKEKQI